MRSGCIGTHVRFALTADTYFMQNWNAQMASYTLVHSIIQGSNVFFFLKYVCGSFASSDVWILWTWVWCGSVWLDCSIETIANAIINSKHVRSHTHTHTHLPTHTECARTLNALDVAGRKFAQVRALPVCWCVLCDHDFCGFEEAFNRCYSYIEINVIVIICVIYRHKDECARRRQPFRKVNIGVELI